MIGFIFENVAFIIEKCKNSGSLSGMGVEKIR